MASRSSCKVLCIAGLLALKSFSAVMAQDQVKMAWPPMTADARPWTRWWWMGDAVDKLNLDRQLAIYHAAGLGGVEVTPIYGVRGWEDRAIPYLSPTWMEMLNHAITTGSSLGMGTDMAMGTGWCFGGPTVGLRDANAVLVTARQTLKRGAMLTGTFDRTNTQALVAFSPDGQWTDLTSRIRSDGRVTWSAPSGTWEVYAVSQKPSGTNVKRAAPGGAGPMLNLFYPAAVSRYMQWFEEPFATAKPNLECVFQDSYEYNSQWGPDFFPQFLKYRGYRLQGELPALLGDKQDEHTARVKSDYRETIDDILTMESIPAWVQWAHEHGYRARYQAHGAPGNLLDLYADADIPETEMFSRRRDILISKFASSAAHIAGKNLASAETGTWMAEHFTETLAEMKYLADAMFLSGINHIVYHGTAYTPDGVPWPGWCFYASTEMNPRNAIWHDVPTLNEYVARCQSVLQSGTPNDDVLVYWPISDRWNSPVGLVQGNSIGGDGWFNEQPIQRVAAQLWDEGYSFDYISDRQLQAIQRDHAPVVLGGSKYRAIVVPRCDLMPVATLKKLLALAAGGTPVLFVDKLPSDVPGLADLEHRRLTFRSLLDSIRDDGDKKANSVRLVHDIVAALSTTGAAQETMTKFSGIHYVRRAYSGGLHYFIANSGTETIDGWIPLHTKAQAVETMDPMTGGTSIGRMRIADDGLTDVSLHLDPGGSIVLRTFDKAGPMTPATRMEQDGAPTELAGSWRIHFIEGGPQLPAAIQIERLASWTILGGSDAQSFSGTACYSLTFDAPGGYTGPCAIDLGNVYNSARVSLNGKALGTLIVPPYRVQSSNLLTKGNILDVEVTNTSANRIRDLDIRHVAWKVFYPPNVLSANYGSFDASKWPLTNSGLLGPVVIIPEKSVR